MNLAVKRYLLFFFSFVAITACEDPSELGLELQDDNRIGTDFTDTLTIQSGTVLLEDSISTFGLAPYPAGYYADPVLGTSRATAFTEVGLGGTDLTFGANPQPVSMTLTLDYSMIYGNQASDLTLNVHRLTDGFSSRGSYYSNSTLPYEATPIGSGTFRPRIFTLATRDSAEVVKIEMSLDFAREILARSGTSALATRDNFINEFLKGIAIVSPNTEGASIIALNLTSTRTTLSLKYRVDADTAIKEHLFPIATTDNRRFYNITADRAGTAISSLEKQGLIPSPQTDGVTYVQANTQLLTKLTIPYLEQFKAQSGNIIINRAELILPVQNASNATFTAHPSFVLYETNSSNRILQNSTGQNLAIQDTYSFTTTLAPSVVTYRSEKGHYRMNITPYLQALLLGRKENNGVLVSTGLVTVSSNGSRQLEYDSRPFRTIISNTDAAPIKLLIYYSKLSQ
ncbi:DUF4270 domain-containing protein [Pontibacter qinzhouensis]|uniref:DUF4270 domain-containing protein n=1 Tax=Pontibacter qinzhouensis TaxID=2603253 RepID=A0A5C8JFB3_9BACT|nr:DUF4270 family protein [Pontibacter qinzhouensis]TXK36399.1 DUF4270 domain-containing protein [Pontibacter qinzhouensis]